jgi:hypothetical protein
MSVVSVPHINFRGDARQALEFYHSVFGGQLMIAAYGQVGIPQDAPDAGRLTFGPVAPDSPDADHVAFVFLGACPPGTSSCSTARPSRRAPCCGTSSATAPP